MLRIWAHFLVPLQGSGCRYDCHYVTSSLIISNDSLLSQRNEMEFIMKEAVLIKEPMIGPTTLAALCRELNRLIHLFMRTLGIENRFPLWMPLSPENVSVLCCPYSFEALETERDIVEERERESEHWETAWHLRIHRFQREILTLMHSTRSNCYALSSRKNIPLTSYFCRSNRTIPRCWQVLWNEMVSIFIVDMKSHLPLLHLTSRKILIGLFQVRTAQRLTVTEQPR